MLSSPLYNKDDTADPATPKWRGWRLTLSPWERTIKILGPRILHHTFSVSYSLEDFKLAVQRWCEDIIRSRLVSGFTPCPRLGVCSWKRNICVTEKGLESGSILTGRLGLSAACFSGRKKVGPAWKTLLRGVKWGWRWIEDGSRERHSSKGFLL